MPLTCEDGVLPDEQLHASPRDRRETLQFRRDDVLADADRQTEAAAADLQYDLDSTLKSF